MNETKKNVPANPELTDEALDKVSGGVQAGLITQGGQGEFSDTKPKEEKEETEEERHRRLMRQAEGKSYL